MQLFIGCVAGVLATLAMDCLGILTIRKKWIDLKGLQIVPLLLGRWALLYFQAGTDIRLTSPLNNEKKVGLILHYLIGMMLGGVFSLLPSQDLQTACLYGIATNVFPWLLMYPAMGFGFFASKLPVQKPILLFSFVNHVMYGFALGFCYRFMIYTL
jgi:hypothetical protein